jgi:hypothetical protein
VPRKVIVIVVLITSLLLIKSQLPQFTAYDDDLLYSDTNYWQWTQSDENVLAGVRKVMPPTEEQLRYVQPASQHPLHCLSLTDSVELKL